MTKTKLNNALYFVPFMPYWALVWYWMRQCIYSYMYQTGLVKTQTFGYLYIFCFWVWNNLIVIRLCLKLCSPLFLFIFVCWPNIWYRPNWTKCIVVQTKFRTTILAAFIVNGIVYYTLLSVWPQDFFLLFSSFWGRSLPIKPI